MKILTISKQSMKAIFANKGRSILTVLGIVIGIGSVIALMSLGSGVKNYITKQINTLGTNTLMVTPGADLSGATSGGVGNSPGSNRGGSGFSGEGASTLTVADYNSLLDKTKNPHIDLVSGNVNGSGIYSNQRFTVIGTTTSLFKIRDRSIGSGQLFNDQDIAAKNTVVDLGYDIAKNLFGDQDPIGKTLKIGSDDYKIIGVFSQATETSFQNPNTIVYAPYTSIMDSLSTDKFTNFSLTATNENTVHSAKGEIQNTLLINHNISDLKLADFSVSTAADLLSTVGNITGILTALLSGIAAISLLVGGIGIMNIMLVSVTERTREIGLRKAVGAKTSDILVQFLIEAIFLTLTGGILGIGLGILMGTIAGRFVGFSPVLTENAILLAVGISMLIGLIFGIYPAARAARLNPIDAVKPKLKCHPATKIEMSLF